MTAKFLDSDGKELRKGFYRHLDDENQFFYFTGKYNPTKNDIPIFENENNDVHNFVANDITYAHFTKKLSEVKRNLIKLQLDKLQKKANFIEKGLLDFK